MIRIEAKTLEEAYSKAALELNCSVTQITFNVIQNPSSGFLGLFSKNAIIEASIAGKKSDKKSEDKSRRSRQRRKKQKKNEDSTNKEVKKASKPENKAVKEEKQISEEKPKKTTKKSEYNTPKVDVNIAVEEIKKDINSLFSQSCFELDEIKVEAYSEDTVLIEFSGVDAALLIGKEGYRYKSLSYLLYNWINIKYGLNIRLEIAEFLKNQEEMISKYLVGVIERINNTGRAQTKILDGVLVKIALEALRKEFPNKYVGIKSGREGGRFIVVNDFNRKNKE
ncbi:Jag N-terminal domain-containing protein [Sulfurospirillum sp. 1307]|jgi:spoIIIJ-associated protein